MSCGGGSFNSGCSLNKWRKSRQAEEKNLKGGPEANGGLPGCGLVDVMLNFVHELNWAMGMPRYLIQWYVCVFEDVSGREWVDWAKLIAPFSVGEDNTEWKGKWSLEPLSLFLGRNGET